MKIGFIFLFTVLSLFTKAQKTPITKYYDSVWVPSTKENATFYTQFVKNDSGYACTSYWTQSNQLNCTSTFADTLFVKQLGLLVRYYKNGVVKDSVFANSTRVYKSYHFYLTGKIQDSVISNDAEKTILYAYYQNGNLMFHSISYPNSDKTSITEGYDSLSGKIIPGFVYEEDAKFPGGMDAWKNYLVSKLRSDFPKKYYRRKETIVVKAVVRFIIDKEGNISDIELEKSSGIPEADENALKIIKGSPKWNYAIQYNSPVNSYKRQPLTYMLQMD